MAFLDRKHNDWYITLIHPRLQCEAFPLLPAPYGLMGSNKTTVSLLLFSSNCLFFTNSCGLKLAPSFTKDFYHKLKQTLRLKQSDSLVTLRKWITIIMIKIMNKIAKTTFALFKLCISLTTF